MEKKLKAGVTGYMMSRDPWEQFEKLAKIGYKTSQNAVGTIKRMEGNLEENIARYKALGMEFYSTGVVPGKAPMRFDYFAKPTILPEYHDLGFGYRCDEEQIEKTVEECEKFGVQIVTGYSTPMLNVKFGLKNCEKDVFYMALEENEVIAEKFAKAGIRYCYHNHDVEFLSIFDCVTAFDQLLTRTSALWLELDIGWVLYAGYDPTKVLERCSDRIASIHAKDLVPGTFVNQNGEVRPNFTALGTGVLDINAFFRMALDKNYETVIFEQDSMRHLSVEESAAASYLNAKETGLVE
jgi:sugar phosphate isomerase/epimerase